MIDSKSFKVKPRTTNNTGDDGTVGVYMTVSLKSLGIFWKTLEMPLFLVKLDLFTKTWSAYCVIFKAVKATTFAKTDAKLYVLVLLLLTWDSTNLPQ